MDKIPVIIDCDTGIDDMISFVLTLASKQLDIRGVTTVAGNVSLPHTTYNTVNGLAFMGRSEVLVAAGEAAPLERPTATRVRFMGTADWEHFHLKILWITARWRPAEWSFYMRS